MVYALLQLILHAIDTFNANVVLVLGQVSGFPFIILVLYTIRSMFNLQPL